MRKVIELQMKLGEIGIKDIEFDLKSRGVHPQFFDRNYLIEEKA